MLVGDRESIVFVNGEFLPESKARISPFDHGLLYGYGVWDTVLTCNGYIFRLEEHIDRLLLSARALGLVVPWSKDQLKQIVIETVGRNRLSNAYAKFLITKGPGPPLITAECEKPSLVVLVHPSEPPVPPELTKGKKAVIVSIRSIPPQCGIEPRIKQLNYLNRGLMIAEAKRAGADYALVMDINGFVVEGATQNLFIVRNKVICTPPLQSVLDGVTRRMIFEIAEKRGHSIVEGTMTPYDVYVADEVFITATAVGGIIPITEVDGRPIGTHSPGGITKELLQRYWEMLQSGEGAIRVF